MERIRLPAGVATVAALMFGSKIGPELGHPWWIAAGLTGLVLAVAPGRARRLGPIAVLLAGAAAGALRTPEIPLPPFPEPVPDCRAIGRVAAWERVSGGVRAELREVRLGEEPIPSQAPVRVWGPAAWPDVPAAGWVSVRGRFVPERGPTNPGQWAETRWLGRLSAGGDAPRWGPGPPPRTAALRRALAARAHERLGGFAGRFASAVLLGRSEELREPERAAFRRSGLAHLVAVSGLHVGLVALLAGLVAGPFGPRGRALAGAAAGGLYALLAGGAPSALRAWAMVTAVAAGSIAGRPRPGTAWLALALPWIVFANPAIVDRLGFRLSVSAVAGIAFALDVSGRRKGGMGAILGGGVVSLGAQWGTLGPVAAAFGTVTPLAVLPNLVAVPLTGLFLPAAMLGLLPAPWGNPFADAARLVSALLRCVLGVASGGLPVLDSVASPPSWTIAAPLVLALAWFSLPRSRRRGAALRVVAALVAVLVTVVQLAPWPPPPGPWVAFLDVEQGDAAVFRTAAGATFAVDVGDDRGPGDAASRVIVPFLRAVRVRRLDGLVVSHRHRDHVGALGGLLDRIAVATVWDAGAGRDRGGTAARVDSVLAAHGMRARSVARGDTLFAGAGESVAVLHPPAGDPEIARGDLNDASVVLLWRGAGFAVLFAGDLEKHGERRVLDGAPFIGATVLKTGHHGSDTSTGAAWLDGVHPDLAVISVGVGNRYGHPSTATLERLRERGVRVHRTDRDGALVLRFPRGGGAPRARAFPPRIAPRSVVAP